MSENTEEFNGSYYSAKLADEIDCLILSLRELKGESDKAERYEISATISYLARNVEQAALALEDRCRIELELELQTEGDNDD